MCVINEAENAVEGRLMMMVNLDADGSQFDVIVLCMMVLYVPMSGVDVESTKPIITMYDSHNIPRGIVACMLLFSSHFCSS